MTDQNLNRLGAALSVIGAVAVFLLNALHPKIPATAEVRGALRLIAESGGWIAIHVGLLIGVLLIIGGLVAVYRALRNGPGSGFALLGFAAALISGGIFCALSGIDGYVRWFVAQRWMAASGEEQAVMLSIGQVLEQINFGFFSVFVFVFFGVTFLLYGLAVTASNRFPRWFGWAAIILALVGVVIGVAQLSGGRSNLVTNVLFPITASLLALWVIVLGVFLWRPETGREVLPEKREAFP